MTTPINRCIRIRILLRNVYGSISQNLYRLSGILCLYWSICGFLEINQTLSPSLMALDNYFKSTNVYVQVFNYLLRFTFFICIFFLQIKCVYINRIVSFREEPFIVDIWQLINKLTKKTVCHQTYYLNPISV